jgi:hypothetical protein
MNTFEFMMLSRCRPATLMELFLGFSGNPAKIRLGSLNVNNVVIEKAKSPDTLIRNRTFNIGKVSRGVVHSTLLSFIEVAKLRPPNGFHLPTGHQLFYVRPLPSREFRLVPPVASTQSLFTLRGGKNPLGEASHKLYYSSAKGYQPYPNSRNFDRTFRILHF